MAEEPAFKVAGPCVATNVSTQAFREGSLTQLASVKSTGNGAISGWTTVPAVSFVVAEHPARSLGSHPSRNGGAGKQSGQRALQLTPAIFVRMLS